MAKAARMTSAQVLDALRAGPMREPAHAWLYEVRNQTGYARRERYADALVVSCWPSRGVWIAGVEVKVDRGDWRRELDNPSKSVEIQRFCDYWWVAAPEGIIETAEVPETWGHFVIEGKKARAAREAPKLAPEPLTPLFVASVLRNASQAQERVRKLAFQEGRDGAIADGDAEALRAEMLELQQAQWRHQSAADIAKGDLSRLQAQVAAWEREAGIDEGTIASGRFHQRDRDAGRHFMAARALAELGDGALAGRLRHAADVLDCLAPKEAAE
jgi:hypothetical protein